MGRQGNTGISIGTNGNKMFNIQNSEYSSKMISAERKINKNIAFSKYEYKITVKPDGIGKTTQAKLLKGVTNPKVINAVKQLYRVTATVGKGGTADALRYEAKSGTKLSRTGHLTKAEGYLKNLERIGKGENLSPRESKLIKSEIRKLKSAIRYYKRRYKI